MDKQDTDKLPASPHDAITALGYSIKALSVALEGNSKAIESINETMENMRDRYARDIAGIQERMSTHSMKCVFAPERDGEAQKTLGRVDILEFKAAKLEGALGLVKWMGFGTLTGVIGLAVKAMFG